jgi:hypothetical protein
MWGAIASDPLWSQEGALVFDNILIHSVENDRSREDQTFIFWVGKRDF